MDMEKLIGKMMCLRLELDDLKFIYYSEGKTKLASIINLLERIIDRIYPVEDALKIKKKLHRTLFVYTGRETDEEKQGEYIEDIVRAVQVIVLIYEESKLFGFSNFKPIKERVENEFGVNGGFFSWFRRTTQEQ